MAVKGPVPRPPFVPFTVPTHGVRNFNTFVFHTTEGIDSIKGLSDFFLRTGDGLGTNYTITSRGGMGSNGNPFTKTYHVRGGNGYCVGCELCGRASRTSREWFTQIHQLWGAAWLAAWVNQRWNIALVKNHNKGVRLAPTGFCGHGDVPGNDHWDPGPNFPWGFVLGRARDWRKNGVPLFVRQAMLLRKGK
jgi:hypothetical protein